MDAGRYDEPMGEGLVQITMVAPNEVDRAVEWFEGRGVPIFQRPSTLIEGRIDLCTDRQHMNQALGLYDRHSTIINVVTGQTVRVASWLSKGGES